MSIYERSLLRAFETHSTADNLLRLEYAVADRGGALHRFTTETKRIQLEMEDDQ